MDFIESPSHWYPYMRKELGATGGAEVVVSITVGRHGDVALPEEAASQLRIEPGTTLLVEVRDGALVLVPEPRGYSDRLRGLHRDVWAGVDPDDYVRQEREGCRE